MEGKIYTVMKTSVDFTDLFQQHSEGFFFSPKFLDTLSISILILDSAGNL